MPNLQSLDKRVTKLEELIHQLLDSIGLKTGGVEKEKKDDDGGSKD